LIRRRKIKQIVVGEASYKPGCTTPEGDNDLLLRGSTSSGPMDGSNQFERYFLHYWGQGGVSRSSR